MKPIDLQLTYKKVIGFTEIQRQSLLTLENYGVNINQFIRQSVKEKLHRDWKQSKEKHERIKMPF